MICKRDIEIGLLMMYIVNMNIKKSKSNIIAEKKLNIFFDMTAEMMKNISDEIKFF